MSMDFVMGGGSVPAGDYRAAFARAEPFDQKVAEYGPAVALKFRIVGGDHDGAETSRICSAKLTPKSTLSKFAVAIKGSPIATGERFSFSSFVGTQGSIIVEPTDSGGSRVSTFLRDAGTPPAAQAPDTSTPPAAPQSQESF